MNDINELRRKLRSDDPIDHIDIHANVKSTLAELIDRLEAAEKERDALRDRLALESQENGALRDSVDRACEERDALRAALQHETDCLEAAKEKIDALCARIEEMEKQEPIGTTGGMPGTTGFTMACFHADKVPIGSKLYALPGAKGESE